MQAALEVKEVWKSYNRNQERRFLSLRDVLTGIQRGKKQQPDWFWALREVVFVLEKGKHFGIIGKNGAGKSTLLKILSRITTPTKGEITIRGGVASLLEVGTGFHPELAGTENIYFKGSMLGMKFHEIMCNLYAEVDYEIADWLWAVLPFTISHPLQDAEYLNVPKGQGDVLMQYHNVQG
jgi:lipopolysaccharide transport system ATP-binding protein